MQGKPMSEITSLFVTRLYRAKLNELAKKKVLKRKVKTLTSSDYFTACSMQGGTRAAQVSISAEDGSVCVRRLSGGPAAQGTPSCHSVAFDNLGCTDVYTGPQ